MFIFNLKKPKKENVIENNSENKKHLYIRRFLVFKKCIFFHSI